MMESLQGETLIRLLDDPDQMVFEAVRQKILEVGPGMLPDLESAATEAMSPVLLERIEHIIKTIQFDQLKIEFGHWIHSDYPRLIDGAWLMTKFQFPDMTFEQFSKLIKPIRDEIWLEISDRLTAMEKIGVINTFLFRKRKLADNESHPDSPGNNFINRLIETGKGNAHSLNLLYAIISQELDLPVFGIETPGHPFLAYMDMPTAPEEGLDPGLFDVLFYINPAFKGLLHARNDITNMLIKLDIPREPGYYEPRPNPDLIRMCLSRLSMDYHYSGSEIRSAQVQDLLGLWK